MIEFTTCFIALNDDGIAKYISHEMTGHRYPANTQRDIYDMCMIMNNVSKHDLRYIDVFHVLDPAGRTVWKEGEVKAIRDDLTITPVDYS